MYVEKRELRVALDHSRVPVAMDITGSEKSGTSQYQLTNISRTGMFLELEDKDDIDLQLGASIHFCLKLPNKIQGVAKVRWVRKKTLGPYLKKGLGIQVLEFHENAERSYLKFLEDSLDNLKVSDLMQPKFASLSVSDTVGAALEMMVAQDLEVVVVTNLSGQPEGVFERKHAVEIALNRPSLETPLRELMDEQPITVSTSSNTDDVYAVMRYGTVNHLPVEEGGVLVGLISVRDLVPFWSEYMELQSKRVSKTYDKVISIVAHDLRTPISVIKTTNQLTEVDGMNFEEYVGSGLPDIIDTSCNTMLQLIDGILDSGQIRQGAISLKRETMDLEDLIDKVARCFAPLAGSKNIVLEVDIPMAVPKIRADSLRLEQVLNNLVSNAIKFCKEEKRIVLGLKAHHSKVALWVADNGPGIPRDEQDYLFEEYFKTSVRATRGEKGSGLGLAICKRIVDAHGGAIRVDSEIGEGTTFTVLLPIEEIQ